MQDIHISNGQQVYPRSVEVLIKRDNEASGFQTLILMQVSVFIFRLVRNSLNFVVAAF